MDEWIDQSDCLDKCCLLSFFKISKLQAQFQSMEVRNSQFAAFIDVFTPNTYVMVIMSDPTIRKFLIYHIVYLFIHLFIFYH